MRIESPFFFLYGSILFAILWLAIRTLSPARMKRHLMALAFALTASPVVAAGHGEGIIVPVFRFYFRADWNSAIAAIVIFSCVVWWMAAFAFLSFLSRHTHT